MPYNASGGDDTGGAYLREEERVRGEFRAASYEIWLGLTRLLGSRWDNPVTAHRMAADQVGSLSDLAKLRCLPDGRPLAASAVFDNLHEHVANDGKTPYTVVEKHLIRGLTGAARTARSAAEITTLIEAFLRCYAADYERGELTWVDEIYAMVVPGGSATTWRLEVPPTHAAGENETIMLRIPVSALKAAGLLSGDQLILEPRQDGLWIGRGPRSST